MKALSMSLVLFMASVAVCQHIDSDLPLPQPTATVNVVDYSSSGAPIHSFGTGDTYMKTVSGDRVMLWMEENNLQFQNVSGKDIAEATVDIRMTDVRSNQYWHTRELANFPAGAVFKVQGKKQPDGRIHISGAHTFMSQAEYHLKRYVTPTIRVHVVSATFADGSTWKAK